MNQERHSDCYRVIACTLALSFLVCMPVNTQSMRRGDCYLPADEGIGNRLTLRLKYYFDSSIDDCSEFIYLGFGGNENRFDTYDECENVCLFKYGMFN